MESTFFEWLKASQMVVNMLGSSFITGIIAYFISRWNTKKQLAMKDAEWQKNFDAKFNDVQADLKELKQILIDHTTKEDFERAMNDLLELTTDSIITTANKQSKNGLSPELKTLLKEGREVTYRFAISIYYTKVKLNPVKLIEEGDKVFDHLKLVCNEYFTQMRKVYIHNKFKGDYTFALYLKEFSQLVFYSKEFIHTLMDLRKDSEKYTAGFGEFLEKCMNECIKEWIEFSKFDLTEDEA